MSYKTKTTTRRLRN